MNRCPQFTHLLVLPRLRIQSANAISSPLTHGFPAMTAFLGLMWALERKARRAGIDRIAFNAVGVVSHGWQEQVSGEFVRSFRLTRNPVDSKGETAAIVEEGRIHLELSMVLALAAEDWDTGRRLADVATIAALLSDMRVAGGSVIPPDAPWQRRYQPFLADFTCDEDAQSRRFREVRARLLPGSALVARDDLIRQRLEQLRNTDSQATALDAWLSLSRTDWHYDEQADGGRGRWLAGRQKGDGWIVPIPVGYGALSPLHSPGSVRNARDADTAFRFVETLYAMGEWLGPHRLRSPQQMLWYADSRPDAGLYRCRNDYSPA